MDNECPLVVKEYIINAKNMQLLLVPPYMHRVNAAEKAIDSYKNHFISGLATLHPDFPLHLWCRLIPLASTTLNLLRPSRINPRLSAEECLNGVFDCNKTPIAPPGCKVVVHESTTNRGTWSPHGVDGWYVGTAPHHYRCHTVYVPKTRAERIAKTVRFFPHKTNIPQNTPQEEILEAAIKLNQALENNIPSVHQDKNETAAALKQLAKIFLHSSSPPSINPPQQAAITITNNNNAASSPRVILKNNAASPRVLTRNSSNKNNSNIFKGNSESARERRMRMRNEIKTMHQESTMKEVTENMLFTKPPRTSSNCNSHALSTNQKLHVIPEDHENFDLPNLVKQVAQHQPQLPVLRKHIAQQHPQPHLICPEINAVLDTTTGNMLEYRQLIKSPDKEIWSKALANDLGRLAQGIGSRMKTGTNTIKFIHPKHIPKGKKVTCCKLVASIRPLKAEKNRVRVTIGGDRLEYEGNKSTTPATLTTVKIHLNSTMSAKEARHTTADIKDF